MLTIKDLSVSKELDISEMSAVRGGLIEFGSGNSCLDIGATLKNTVQNEGPAQMIAVAAEIMGGQTYGKPVCPT